MSLHEKICKLCYFITVMFPMCDSFEKTELQESLQSVMERVNVTKGRKERMHLLQQVTRFRRYNEKQPYKPRLIFL